MEVKEQEVDQLVLCYGTLKFGWSNYTHCIKPFIDAGTAEYLGAIQTKPNFTMVSLGSFPGVIPQGETSIKGDLFRIKDKKCLIGLNRLEGHYGKDNPDNFYNITEVETEKGKALMYILDESYLDSRRIVESGEWTKNERYY